jgi:NTE family protein
VGQEAAALAQSLAKYTGERLLLLDLHASPPSVPHAPAASHPIIEQRTVRHLDSKALTTTLQEGLAQFDRVIVAAPNELHSPLMSVISLIDLVIDPSGTEVPWVIAAARRRWTIPAERPPDVERIARRLCQRVLGVALSGGAARTLAHIGALRALEEAKVPIDMIASTGIGAVIAGLYAAGLSVDELTDLAIRHDKDLNPFDGSLNLRLVSRSALYAGKHARQSLRKLLQDRTFKDLRIPLYIVAADLESGQPVVFQEGPLIDALEASLALAGLVAPAERHQRHLVDGGFVNPMPADILVEHGAGLVVGVNSIPRPNRKGILPAQGKIDLTSTWLRLRDQLAYAALMNSLRHLDLLIMLQVDQFDGTDFDRAAELIASGLAATQREIHHIRTLLAPDTRL